MVGVVTATILSKGLGSSEWGKMNPGYELLHIDTLKEVNRIATAQIILGDGDATKKEFKISNSSFFAPGQEIKIQLHYEGHKNKEKTIFQGIIVRHTVESDLNQSRLSIDLKDHAVKLTTQRRNSVFPKQPNGKITDQQIIKEIISAYDGVTHGSLADTGIEHGEMVQWYCTDWDFILSRAEANGLWVLVDDSEITVMLPNLLDPELNRAPSFRIEYGQTELYAFEMEADIQHQLGSVSSQTWHIEDQALSKALKAKDDYELPGNLTPKTLATAIAADDYSLMTSSALATEELQAWADAKLNKARLSMLRGRISIPGVAGLKLGDIIEISGVSDRFNGKTRITGIRHQVSAEGWKTDLQFGLSADWFLENRDIVDVPASGLVPAINGLQIGIVEKYLKDPESKRRVRVRIPALANKANETGTLVWARMAMLDAGSFRGICFWPEAGDEVILGFLNDDPRQALILGSLYSAKNTPPWEIKEENHEKGMITRESLKFSFNDEKKSITIETPQGNTLLMDEAGIQVKSKKDIILKAENITIEATSNVKTKGAKVDVD